MFYAFQFSSEVKKKSCIPGDEQTSGVRSSRVEPPFTVASNTSGHSVCGLPHVTIPTPINLLCPLDFGKFSLHCSYTSTPPYVFMACTRTALPLPGFKPLLENVVKRG